MHNHPKAVCLCVYVYMRVMQVVQSLNAERLFSTLLVAMHI